MHTFSELEPAMSLMDLRFSSLDRDDVEEPTYEGRVYVKEYTILMC